jgi:carboxypeptidase B
MKLLVVLALVGLAFAKRFDGDQVLTLFPTTQQHLSLIRQFDEIKADFWKPDSSASIQLNQETDIRFEYEHVKNVKHMLVKAGLDYKVKIFNLQESIDGQFDNIRNKALEDYDYSTYHTTDEIELWVNNMAATHPQLARASVIGKSFEGRNINMLTLGTSANNPIVLLDCGIHAREWISPSVCQCYVDHLLHQYGSDATVTTMMKSLTFAIIPLLNPDGYEYTWTDDRMWRKTRSNYGTLCTGVDPNRNFDANWSGPGSSSNPCSETYYGPSVASEPLSQALQNYVKSNSDRIKMYITLHSYGQVFIYPYSYAYQDVANKDEHDAVFVNAAAAIKAVHSKTYTGGPGYSSMYLAAGGSDDFSYDAGADLAFTIELRDTGRYGFILPESQILDTCAEMHAGLDYMFNYAMSL